MAGGPLSWQANEAIRQFSRLSGAERSVAYTLATYAGPRGTGAFPSRSTLREGSGASEATVKRALRNLVANGEATKGGKHRSGTFIYSLAPLVKRWEDEREGGHSDPPDTDIWDEEGSGRPPGGVKEAVGGVIFPPRGVIVNPEPSVEPPFEPKGETNSPFSDLDSGKTDSSAPPAQATPTEKPQQGEDRLINGRLRADVAEELANWQDALPTMQRENERKGCEDRIQKLEAELQLDSVEVAA